MTSAGTTMNAIIFSLQNVVTKARKLPLHAVNLSFEFCNQFVRRVQRLLQFGSLFLSCVMYFFAAVASVSYLQRCIFANGQKHCRKWTAALENHSCIRYNCNENILPICKGTCFNVRCGSAERISAYNGQYWQMDNAGLIAVLKLYGTDTPPRAARKRRTCI